MQRRTRHRRTAIGALVAVAAGLMLAGTGAAPAMANEDDDMVAFDAATGEQISRQGQATAVSGSIGYYLAGGQVANVRSYTVRLIQSPRAEQYRAVIQAAADELRAAGLAQLTVAAGQFADHGPAEHEIVFRTLSTSPCGTTNIAGCGGPTLTSRATSGWIGVGGQTWMLPVVDGYSATAKRHVVAHELGHALGLGHYSEVYGGSVQLMHPSSYAATTYQSGDRLGLGVLARGEKPRGSVDAVTVPSTGKLRVTGWAVDPDLAAAAKVRLSIDGVPIADRQTTLARADVVSSLGLKTTTPRGFDTTIDVAAGGHVLCVSAQDYPGTTFEPIAPCRAVTGAGAVAVDRVQGADRYASAAAVSHAAFPATAPVVVVANGDAFPDALAAGPVASRLGGPLLLTQAGALPAATAAEIARLKPQKIVVAGGTASVSDAVYAALGRLTTTMARVGGSDRYDTSRRLATYAFASAATAYVASGDAFPDALGAGAAAARAGGPLLLVNTAANAGIDAPTASLLTKLKTTRVRVAGGAAAVADGTVNTVKAAVADTKRVYGSDRFETAVALSKDGFTSTSRAFLVNGMNFPDGIVTPPLAAKTGSPVFLSPGTCVPKGVLTELGRLSVRTFTLVGGTTSLTAAVAGMQPCA